MTNTETTFTRTINYSDSSVFSMEGTDRDPVTGKVTVRFTTAYYGESDPDVETLTFVPNVEAFQSALDQITNNPETWNQGDWLMELPSEVADRSLSAAPECGTAGCLAGTVALLAGARPVVIVDEDGSFDGKPYTYTDWTSVTVPGRAGSVRVAEFADRELGIGEAVAGWSRLFTGSNTLFELWERSQALCGGALDVPADDVIAAAQEVSWHLYGH